MTYNVFGGTLNPILINQPINLNPGSIVPLFTVKLGSSNLVHCSRLRIV